MRNLKSSDPLNDTGYKNEAAELSDEQLLHNIQDLAESEQHQTSASLVKDLGRCSLDIEMETYGQNLHVYIKNVLSRTRSTAGVSLLWRSFPLAIREGVKECFGDHRPTLADPAAEGSLLPL